MGPNKATVTATNQEMQRYHNYICHVCVLLNVIPRDLPRALSLPRSRCLIHVNDLSYCRSIFKSLSKHCRSCVGTVPIPRQERFAILPNLCRTLRHVFGRVPSASTYPAPLAITLAMAVTLPMVTDTTYGNNP